jgi:alpha-maltose-1-phosphate synthase
MRIAHINPGRRGIASYALNIYNYFKAFEPSVDNLIVSEAEWTKQPIPVFHPKSVLIADILPLTCRYRDTEDRLVEYKPDVLHHHFPCGRLDFYIDRLRVKLGAPVITTIHISVGSKKYFIDWVMHNYFLACRGNSTRDKETSCYVAICKFVQKQLEEIGGLPKNRIVLLYAGVDPEIYAPVDYYPHDWLEITFCGQMMPEKGVDMLVKAVMQLSEERKVRLNLIGDGNLKSMLEAKTKGRAEFNWTGLIKNPREIAAYYARSDVIVLPTRWDEAFSYIPLEAMSCGTPVIASRTGGNTEIIQDGVNGYLFEQGNYQDLYDRLKAIDITQCWDMGRNGRELILKRHTLKTFGEKYGSLYRNMAEDPAHLRQID